MVPGYAGVTDWHRAQINIGRLEAPRGDPRGASFVEGFDQFSHSDPAGLKPDPRCVGNA